MTPLEALEKMKMDMQYHRNSESCYYYPKKEREEYMEVIENELKAAAILKSNLCLVPVYDYSYKIAFSRNKKYLYESQMKPESYQLMRNWLNDKKKEK